MNSLVFNEALTLQSWLAPQLGVAPEKWYQVTIYRGEHRLTHDVLLGVPFALCCTYGCAHFMPQVAEAWQSVVQHTKTATADVVLHVTRCSDADCDAVLALATCSGAENAESAALLKKYASNVAFMIHAVVIWPHVFEQATKSMQKNEFFAAAAVYSSSNNAPLIDPDLWKKASFVVQAARNDASASTVLQHCSDVIKKDHETMLSLVKLRAHYCDNSVVKGDFELLVQAVAVNKMCLWYISNAETLAKVADALPSRPDVRVYCQELLKSKRFKQTTSQKNTFSSK